MLKKIFKLKIPKHVKFLALVLIGFFLLLIFSFFFIGKNKGLDNYFKNLSNKEVVQDFVEPRMFVGSKFRGQVFLDGSSDSFYSLDSVEELENLYFMQDVHALTFSPEYKISSCDDLDVSLNSKEISDEFFLNEFPNYNQGVVANSFLNYYDKRCLESDCLEQKALNLFLNNKPLNIPLELEEPLAITIGKIENDFFVVGFVYQEEDSYQGLVYILKDGYWHRILEDKEFKSSYFGLFGFGGSANDFLVIYGASEGLAYRLSSLNINDLKNYVVEDLKEFFGFKLMSNGFKPEVLRLEKDDRVSFYIFSLSTKKPRLIKLWENQSGLGISGVVNLNSGLGKLINVKENSINKLTLFNLLEDDNFIDDAINFGALIDERCFIFSDLGFNNKEEAYLITKLYPNSELEINYIRHIRSLLGFYVGFDKASLSGLSLNKPKIFFQSDLDYFWKIIDPNNPDALIGSEFKNFRFKLVFPAQVDKFYSPFLKELAFNYYYSKHY